MMNSYQTEQLETLVTIRRYMGALSKAERDSLRAQIRDYLGYRDCLGAFFVEHFRDICTQQCFLSRRSACCSKDSIITFFADVLVNVLISPPEALDRLEGRLQTLNQGYKKCVYLGPSGCLWHLKPIVCETFLCDTAIQKAFEKKPQVEKEWQALKERKKKYTWPDRPVLFDTLEQYFLAAGCISPLMYCHNSPGMLRVKKQAKERNRK